MCTFSVLWGSEMLCAYLYVPPICASMHDTCMTPDVEFTVFKIFFYEIFIMLVSKFITKTIFLKSSDTNLEFNLVVKILLVVRTCLRTICIIYNKICSNRINLEFNT